MHPQLRQQKSQTRLSLKLSTLDLTSSLKTADNVSETDLVGLVEALVAEENERANADVKSPVAIELKNLVERLNRAGEKCDRERVACVTSLLSGSFVCSITRRNARMLAQRALHRAAHPELQARVTGKYELNAHATERAMRAPEAQMGINVQFHQQRLQDMLASGFTPDFRRIVLITSFFSISHVCRIAAADFLRNPNLMMSKYLELSAAVEALAESGILSKSGALLHLVIAPPEAHCLRFLLRAWQQASELRTLQKCLSLLPQPVLITSTRCTDRLIQMESLWGSPLLGISFTMRRPSTESLQSTTSSRLS